MGDKKRMDCPNEGNLTGAVKGAPGPGFMFCVVCHN